VDALRLAVRDLLERHESLRTVFPVAEGEPWQKIVPVDPLSVPLDVVPATMASLAAQLQEASIRPFDLACELPIRVTLCVLGPNEHVLLLVLHHIAGDGTSLTPLWRDLSTAYAARLSGEPPAWTPLPLQYADYTLWQQRWLGSAEDAASVTARELQFWREALAGLPDELTLPTDRPRPRVASYQGGTVPIAVGADLLARLQQLARHENASLFMVLQGALAVLLSRLGAGTDIPLGTPIAGRLDDALHDQVGFYVNTLVMRTDLSGEPTFREVLRRVREFDLAAFAHQELSFEQLVQELQPTRSLARHPLFQVMLVLQNTGLVEESLGALAIAEEPLSQTTARFDLLWNLAETAGEGLRGSLEFADDLFDRESVTLLVQRFVRVLHQITTDADRPVSDLDVLLEEEPQQVLEWGRGPRPADAPLGILESFARRVAERPQALAVRDDRHSLTYADLALRVDQWATALRERGVGAESLVAIRLGRSVDFVVAMLATLRAGGAYLPLEEQTPEARLRQILESADPALLLTTRVLGEQVGWRATEFVDEWAPVVAAELRTNWPIATDAQAAYCIHTSGSTGRPKGIVGLHGTLRNLIAWQEPTPRPIRVAQFTAVGFDVSPQEILTALLTGGSLHVVDEPTRLDPELFVDFLIRERITDLFVPFIVLENLASAAEDLGRTIPELREVHQAGEALRVTPLLRQFFARHPDCRLHNHYGPAETHVVTACTLPTDPRDWPEQPTIGRPIQGIQAYVLDERLRLMPPGAVGELCFSGVGVNRGYLNSPEETAAKFVHDPWSERTGERLYRTGDLGRWRRDGTLDFLGRIDQQVKIRGVRVEPAEIERAILDQGGATQAAVVPWTGQRGETLLAAYVVPREGRPMDMSALRHHLASVLPAAMIPAAMIAVAQIPLTVNGKLDRSRLPTPQEDPADEASRPPTTTTQQRLAEMFGEILSQTPVGIDDCFFRLGGHSLLATRLASRIRRSGGRTADPRGV
ncbi:MAG: non-ribosomal peptide synthetase, partial [Planctomycetaceae bacterium]